MGTNTMITNKKYNPSRFAGAIISMGVGVNGDKAAAARKIQIPLLVMTSEDDKVVPPSGAKSLVAEVKKLGSDVTFVLYKSAGHNPRQGAGSMYEHMTKFFTKFETKPPPTPTAITATNEWPE